MERTHINTLLVILLAVSLCGNIFLVAVILGKPHSTDPSSETTTQEMTTDEQIKEKTDATSAESATETDAIEQEDLIGAEATTAEKPQEEEQKTIELNYDYDYLENWQYQQSVSIFTLNHEHADVVIAGDSIVQSFRIHDFFPDVNLLNRGVGSDVSAGLLNRMDEIIGHDPSKVFILIGINDAALNIPPDSTLDNVKQCVKMCTEQGINVYLISILPIVDRNDLKHAYDNIIMLNEQFEKLSDLLNVEYIDAYSSFFNDAAIQRNYFDKDGVHLSSDGYMALADCIAPYIYQ